MGGLASINVKISDAREPSAKILRGRSNARAKLCPQLREPSSVTFEIQV
jgi:hypothetical protein